MSATPDLSAALAAADTAAAAGDFATAADRLRDALAIQEATLGASHPDLADTLNNLGVASERAQRMDDAERYYRRALAVATAAFPADHPFVATSRANLREFCDANGRAFEPPLKPTPAPPPTPPAASPKPAPRPAPVTTTPPPRPASPPAPAPKPVVVAAAGPSNRVILIGAAVFIAVVILILLALRGRSDSTPPPQQAAATSTPTAPAPQPTAPQPKTATPPAPAAGTGRAAAAPSPGSPTLVNFRLCRSLETGDGEWNCDRATSPVRAGALIFLTRVKSERDITVQHKWYRGQELVRSAQLKIAANPTEGYRTYSRYFVTAGPDWRVELRTSEGALMHEEKFAVK